MQLECLLDLLKTKGYIKIRKQKRVNKNKNTLNLPTEYRIDSKNNLNTENFTKIKQLIKQTNEVITTMDSWNNGIMFVLEKDLKTFINEIDSMDSETIRLTGDFNYLTKAEMKWINENTTFETTNCRFLTNNRIKQLRLNSENQKNKEAEKLLNALLN